MPVPAPPAPLSRAGELSLEMTRWPSVTESDGEAEFSTRLAALLAKTDYFGQHPDHLMVLDSHGDPARQNVLALVKGHGRRCIVLAGHFDTVSIANYGALSPLACEPDLLLAALIAELSAKERTPTEEKTLGDLESGSFLPGRGLLDMKSGLAAGIAALDRFAAIKDRVGNILFVATPDEENRSRGMRSFRGQLPQVAARFDLDIVGGINLDASGDDKDGAEGRAMYLGSVGKFSPFAYVIGRPTHAGYAFDGVSAHLISAEIIRAIETNSGLCDEDHGELSPAPVCLEARDMRNGYEVTTPAHVWLSFNWLTHRRTPQELLGDFKAKIVEALSAALSVQSENAASFFARQSIDRRDHYQGTVMTYADLLEKAERHGGKAATGRLASLAISLASSTDPLSATREIVASAIKEAAIEGPAVIVGFSSLHYPRVHLGTAGKTGRLFHDAMERAARTIETRHDTRIKTKEFFAGISDMSFFGHRPAVDQSALLAANTPCPAFVDTAPDTGLSFPVVNIGPWGRDYHQKWERVHTGYTFDILPDFIFTASMEALTGEDEASRPVPK